MWGMTHHSFRVVHWPSVSKKWRDVYFIWFELVSLIYSQGNGVLSLNGLFLISIMLLFHFQIAFNSSSTCGVALLFFFNSLATILYQCILDFLEIKYITITYNSGVLDHLRLFSLCVNISTTVSFFMSRKCLLV